jgi:hypothetical protein
MQFKFFLLFFIYFSSSVWAYETDQYSVSVQPLADVGEDLSYFIYQGILNGITEVNHEKKTLPGRINQLEKELAQFPKDISFGFNSDYPPLSVYKKLYAEVSELKEKQKLLQTKLGIISFIHEKYSGIITWNDQRDGVFGVGLSYVKYADDLKSGKPVIFNHSKFSTVYSYAGFHRLISPSFFVFASTIKAYDVMMGVDKFGHFINQGFQYFQMYSTAINSKKNPDLALKEMVSWGVDSEDGVFGSIVDGVYSNADLAANFAGFIFYQNMFDDLNIQGVHYPRIININAHGELVLNEVPENSSSVLLKRFMSDHFDESLNPSELERPQRFIVRKAIMNRCSDWKKYYRIDSKEAALKRTTSLKNWNGYDYGNKAENTLKIEDICF